MFEVFIIVLSLIWIIFASIQDLKSREIANWLNFSLILFVLAFRFFYSLFNESFAYFYQGLIGFVIFFIIGNILYYGKMFAGGDAKLMYAMGVILPISPIFSENLRIFAVFFFCFFITAFFYTLIASIYYALKNKNKFKKKFKIFFKKFKNPFIISLSFGGLLVATSFFVEWNTFLFLGIIFIIMPLLYIYTKSVDESSMVVKLPVGKLVEGDWLYKDLKINGNKISAKWSGLNSKEIALIKKHKKYVQVRGGLPFAPIFLISFVLTLIVYYIII